MQKDAADASQLEGKPLKIRLINPPDEAPEPKTVGLSVDNLYERIVRIEGGLTSINRRFEKFTDKFLNL